MRRRRVGRLSSALFRMPAAASDGQKEVAYGWQMRAVIPKCTGLSQLDVSAQSMVDMDQDQHAADMLSRVDMEQGQHGADLAFA